LNVLFKACQAIKKSIKDGKPVMVGCAFDPIKSLNRTTGRINPSGRGGHFVLIVGCNSGGDVFLYIDPWFGGSKFNYGGGISPLADKCLFIGKFKYLASSTFTEPGGGTRTGPLLVQAAETYGTFGTLDPYLEVVEGPL